MSINYSNGTTYNGGYNGSYHASAESGIINNSLRQRMALNALNQEQAIGGPMSGCQINPEPSPDFSPYDSYTPQENYAPQDTYAPQDSSSQGIYSPRDFQPQNGNSQAGPEPSPVLKPKPVARPIAAKPVAKKSTGARVKPQKQRNSVSCGQTSVAMGVNYLTGKKLTDSDIARKYGFSLLTALKSESKGSGYTWADNGNFSKNSWPAMERRLNQEKTPVLMGLSGQFSPSGRGHIITLMSIDGNKVTYADPADGKVKTTTKQAIERAPGHPDGKFMYVASKV